MSFTELIRLHAKHATLALILVSAFPALASAQTRLQYPDQRSIGGILTQDRIPEAALQTPRGRDLVNQLRVLRTSASQMGPRHPLLPGINDDIAITKQRIEAVMISDRVLRGRGGTEKLASAVPALEENDLRDLVMRLIARISALEEQVGRLE